MVVPASFSMRSLFDLVWAQVGSKTGIGAVHSLNELTGFGLPSVLLYVHLTQVLKGLNTQII